MAAGGVLTSTPDVFPLVFPPQCDMVSDVCYKVSGVQRCVNTDPGFHCLPCPKRYKGLQPFGMGVEAARKHKQVSRVPVPQGPGIGPLEPKLFPKNASPPPGCYTGLLLGWWMSSSLEG